MAWGPGKIVSPEFDLLAGAKITAIGIDALRHVDHPSQQVPATLPIVFSVHQLLEAVVWWSFDATVSVGPASGSPLCIWRSRSGSSLGSFRRRSVASSRINGVAG